MMQLEDIRREYLLGALDESTLQKDPISQFELWLQQAIDAKLTDPTAMVLATSNSEGQPSQRIVLLKHLDANGFVFFTNYESNKSRDLDHNPKLSMHFPWHAMERQVIVCGRASKLDLQESKDYFASRPKGSQIAAWASPQSREISSRQFLLDRVSNVKERFADSEIPLPSFWGGYKVEPESIEFWQGGGDRLHDRVIYRLDKKLTTSDSTLGTWSYSRLAP